MDTGRQGAAFSDNTYQRPCKRWPPSLRHNELLLFPPPPQSRFGPPPQPHPSRRCSLECAGWYPQSAISVLRRLIGYKTRAVEEGWGREGRGWWMMLVDEWMGRSEKKVRRSDKKEEGNQETEASRSMHPNSPSYALMPARAHTHTHTNTQIHVLAHAHINIRKNAITYTYVRAHTHASPSLSHTHSSPPHNSHNDCPCRRKKKTTPS